MIIITENIDRWTVVCIYALDCFLTSLKLGNHDDLVLSRAGKPQIHIAKLTHSRK